MLLIIEAVNAYLGHDDGYFDFYTLSKVPRVMGTIHDVHAHFDSH